MAKKPNGDAREPKLYKAYRFTGKDPVIADIRGTLQRTLGNVRLSDKRLREIEADGGPSLTAMHNWFFGETRRPQNATLEACLRAAGFKRVIVEDK